MDRHKSIYYNTEKGIKKMKKIFMVTLAIMCAGMMLFAFSACSGESKEDNAEPTIVGKWVYESADNMYYTFNEDGTGSYFFVGGEMKFTYEDDGDAVTIKYENSTEPSIYKYTIEKDVLSIEDSFGEIVKYVKK